LKYNLKNCPKEAFVRDEEGHIRDWHEWFEGFEAELREMRKCQNYPQGCHTYSTASWKKLLTEILGE